MSEENFQCEECNGQGYIHILEDGISVQHPCYHCGTTGSLDPKQRRADQKNMLAYLFAVDHINQLREESEDWGEVAGESGMSLQEFTDARLQLEAEKFNEGLMRIDEEFPSIIDAMIYRILEISNDQPVNNQEKPVFKIVTVENSLDDSEVPF